MLFGLKFSNVVLRGLKLQLQDANFFNHMVAGTNPFHSNQVISLLHIRTGTGYRKGWKAQKAILFYA